MPLRKSKARTKRGKQRAASRMIRELHGGKVYARTRRKYGKTRANKQAVAIALRKAGLSKKK